MANLAVFFPGLGYNSDKPLLYYSKDVAFEAGYTECIDISYSYTRVEGLRANPEATVKLAGELYEQVVKQLEELNWDKYDKVVFISKSIGTILAAKYAKEFGLLTAKQILYTPLTYTYKYAPVNAIAFIGSNDEWSDIYQIDQLSGKTGIPLEKYEGLNHSLKSNNTLSNIEVLSDIMLKTKKFLMDEAE